MFLQEVSGAFIAAARAHPALAARYVVLAPAALDARRDQNSVLLLARAYLVSDQFDAAQRVLLHVLTDHPALTPESLSICTAFGLVPSMTSPGVATKIPPG